ncbi:hypothetical protein ACFQ0K_02800 [Nocardioides caeni]|uniref:Fenitrothion hydrolase n=1 Tax=Nocardioides caeni TaxID=574700 RepID=A0A4S8NMS7_9ACTN|nr:hypothetical protein [Nocardioides caeni]THV18250.1 hypothetical protein E9934_00995 [Nocardioides caeni]
MSGTPLAHGLGGQKDLPISLELAMSGAVAALVVSFTVLVVAWRRPRYDGGDHPGRPAPALLDRVTASPTFAIALRVLGMAFALFTAFTAIAGKESLTNPFFGIFFVWWWVGLVFASAILGPVWRAISPVRTINELLARIAGSDPETGLVRYPAWLGYWPAALGLYAFVWFELVYKYPTELGSVRLWCALYVGVMLVGGSIFGNRFYELADPFEVFSSLIAKLSPWARADAAPATGVSLTKDPTIDDVPASPGALLVRSPLANLATVEPRPGLVAVVAILFGSTGFDSFRESTWWVKYYQGASMTKFTLDNLALPLFCLTAGVLFTVACALTRSSSGTPRSELPRRYAHSILPIVLGYFVAHYLTLFLDMGTLTLARISDPLGKGWDLFGTAAVEPSYWFSYNPSVLATVKVLAVVIGHVVAAVAAHDRALTLLPERDQITGQLPLLVVMVGFTAGGLYLLFSA